ncbi:ABC transporter permease subunit [Streptomyces sulphureus]|uniref:ABC transporter permease subunit n=1 Tax=Streptomyces sulphureus TaxID=47758 RepID=UPI00036FC0C1
MNTPHTPPDARAAGTGAPAGVAPGTGDSAASIHDIGYRNYTGQRLGGGYILRSLLVQTLRGVYGLGRSAKSKVLPMCLFAVMVLPAAIVVAVTVVTKTSDLPLSQSEYVLTMQPVIGIFLAAAAPQAISLDLRHRTTPLYFSRPLERSEYVTAKYGALAAALFVFTAVPAVVLYAGALLAKLDFADQTGNFALGLVMCALFSVLHAGIAAAIAAHTPRRGFGVAGVIVAFTVPYFLVSALQGIAWDQDALGVTGWIGLASPGSLMDGVQATFLGGESTFPGSRTPPLGEGAVYLLLTAALIAGSYFLLLRRYRKAGL